MIRSNARHCLVAVFFAGIFAAPATEGVAQDADYAIEPVVVTGDPVPDSGGRVVVNAGPASLSDTGEAAVRADLGINTASPDSEAILSARPSGVLLVTRTGDAAPDTSGAILDNFSAVTVPLLVNGRGEFAFDGELAASDPGADTGAWRGLPGSIALLARTGDPAPGTVGVFSGLTMTGFPSQGDITNIGVHALADSGHVAFIGTLASTAAVIDAGIWVETTNGLNLVAHAGDSAPGADGSVFTHEFSNPRLNASDTAAFAARLDDIFGTDQGVWVGAPGGLSLIARMGDAAPGGGGFQSFDAPLLNDANDVAFVARLDALGNGGIFVRRGTVLGAVARSGEIAPGAGGRIFRFFGDLTLNSLGQVGFTALLDPGSTHSTDAGLWIETANGLTLAARAGEIAPGTGTMDRFIDFSAPVLNALGQVAFLAELDGTGGTGIWTGMPGALSLIARVGGFLEVAPGDSRQVAALGFIGDAGREGSGASGFNDLGELVFSAEFTDGTSGVFRAALPGINHPPVADAGPDQSAIFKKGRTTTVTLDGAPSTDPDGAILSYVWSRDASPVASGATAQLTLEEGIYTFTLTVTDDAGAQASDDVMVTVQKQRGNSS